MPQTKFSKETAQNMVRQAQQSFWAALQKQDRAAFAGLLAEDFIARSPGQSNQGKDEFINSLIGFPVQVRSIGSDNLEVHVWGEIAVVTGVQISELALTDGRAKLNTIAVTNIFQYQQGRWLMTLAHAVALDQSRPTLQI